MAFNNDNENLFKNLLANSNNSFGSGGFGNAGFGNSAYGNSGQNSQSLSNMNMAKADSGGIMGGKINPLGIAMGVANSGINIAQAVMKPKFDFGQENYTAEQAGQAQGDRASGIAKAAGGAIPVVGGVLGGIFGMIAQKIAQRKGEERANMVLGNRESHIKNLEDYQMNKIKENNFLKSSDMYKNMFNQNQFEV
jgi:hypothetical protein